MNLYRPPAPGGRPTGARWPIVVDRWIPRVIAVDPSTGDFGQATASIGRGAQGQVLLWPFLVEKAMATAIGGWDDLGEGGSPDRENVLYQLLTGQTALRDHDWRAAHGHRASQTDWRQMSDRDLVRTLALRLADHDIVTASILSAFAGLPHGLVGSHTYTVSAVDLDAKTIQLRNPWGQDHPAPLTAAEFRRWVRYVTYGDFGPDTVATPQR